MNAAMIRALKATAGAGLVLPVAAPAAWLRPVATDPARLDPADVGRLTAWRNRHVRSFLTEFEATPQRTADWLTRVVGPRDSKILFMVDEPDGRTVGYMGLDYIDWERRYGEADAIVRGEDAPRGLMRAALLTLLRWGRRSLGLERLDVRVLADNPAVEFYRKVGFVEHERIPLRRTEGPGGVAWVEDRAARDAERQLVCLTWKEHGNG